MKALLVCLLAAVATYSLAQSVVGRYNGKILLSQPTFPSDYPAVKRKSVEEQMERVRKSSFQLVVSANKTFTLAMSAGVRPEAHKVTGKWERKGSALTLTPDNPGGVANSDRPLALTVSKDGKTLTRRIEQKLGTVTYVFKRM